MAEEGSLAGYFDRWYADMLGSPVKDEIQRRHLGLPPELQSTSSLPWSGLDDVVDSLRLGPGSRLLDLACGRGGYGLAIARRTGASLVGVDFSREALRQARVAAAAQGVRADFRWGQLDSTGLPAASVDAVLCIDSIQFADDGATAYAELHRVLVPGGRVVLTCWEPIAPGDERVPARLRMVDLAGSLAAAGFTEVDEQERADWRAMEHGMWEEAAALDPGDDVALQSFHAEGVRSLATWGLLRRVLASATARDVAG